MAKIVLCFVIGFILGNLIRASMRNGTETFTLITIILPIALTLIVIAVAILICCVILFA